MIMIPPLQYRSATPRFSQDAAGDVASVPAYGWLRRACADARNVADRDVEDVALAAGAAIGALCAVVQSQQPGNGAWRLRLALGAAEVSVRQSGRREDKAALRDALLLTRAGDDVGPAGRILLSWRRLATRPAAELLAPQSLAAMLDAFGVAQAGERAEKLSAELEGLAATRGTAGLLRDAFIVAGHHGLAPSEAAWLADALLAQRLGWRQAIPLTGTVAGQGVGSRRGGTASSSRSENLKPLLAGFTRAAIEAVELSVELERGARRLLAVAPKLRAKASGRVVERLLGDDALSASVQIAGMSDRGLRRLFDRLVSLGAVRELTGRPSFRLYGL